MSPAEEPSSSPSKTTLFGKYEVGKLLGCGAFAKVHHARHAVTGQSVAIKSISKQKIANKGLSAHIKREVSIMSLMRHPHIVRLHEVMATNTKVHLIMDFAKGGELFSKLSRGRFSESLSRTYFHQLISAVRYCHARGVHHRDIKPENLLLDDKSSLKVTDFGLSSLKGCREGPLHTVCGTPAYVAPEILLKKGYKGAGVDVWSCGVVLFALNAGYLPFNHPNLMSMYCKIYKGEYTCPKWFSPDLTRFISRILDPNPGTRISVDQLMEDPWFVEGYREIGLKGADDFFDMDSSKHLNAFDIISYSSGLDLSNIVGCRNYKVTRKRFSSEEKAKDVVGCVEGIARGSGLAVERDGDSGLIAEARDINFALVLSVYALTERVCVVEIKMRYGWDECGRALWQDTLWPEIHSLVCRLPATS